MRRVNKNKFKTYRMDQIQDQDNLFRVRYRFVQKC